MPVQVHRGDQRRVRERELHRLLLQPVSSPVLVQVIVATNAISDKIEIEREIQVFYTSFFPVSIKFTKTGCFSKMSFAHRQCNGNLVNIIDNYGQMAIH